MSGGSCGYVAHADLTPGYCDLEEVTELLARAGASLPVAKAIEATEEVLSLMRRINEAQPDLINAWTSVDRFGSGDDSLEQLQAEVQRWWDKKMANSPVTVREA